MNLIINYFNVMTVSYIAGFLMKKTLSWILDTSCDTCNFELSSETL